MPDSESQLLFPGSDAAVAAGCQCPQMDNGRGDPAFARDRGGWVIVITCPLHGGDVNVTRR